MHGLLRPWWGHRVMPSRFRHSRFLHLHVVLPRTVPVPGKVATARVLRRPAQKHNGRTCLVVGQEPAYGEASVGGGLHDGSSQATRGNRLVWCYFCRRCPRLNPTANNGVCACVCGGAVVSTMEAVRYWKRRRAHRSYETTQLMATLRTVHTSASTTPGAITVISRRL